MRNGHAVTMVCLKTDRSETGLNGPASQGRRSGMDGIEVIEFNLPYSNHAGLLERALVFLRYSWNACSWRFVLMLIWCLRPPRRLQQESLALSPVG